MPDAVPAGLPSELLERRPDVHEAEEIIVAANAQIGVAKANFLPNIALTGTGGVQSNALNSLLKASSESWFAALDVTQPIFEGGALRSELKLTRAQYQEAVLAYQRTLQNAFEQVSNGLITYQKYRDFRGQQELLTHAAQ